ncbi:MAG: hypothetical protein WA738_05030 [Candidatus Angelobacter sp.]
MGLSASVLNSAGSAVTALVTYNSSNTRVATVSPSGLVCGGVWDSTFVVCNGNDASGNPITGSATITATAQGITSGPVSVSVHPSVTSVTIDPITSTGCFSIAQTHQFTPHAFHNGTEITSSVGSFTWSSSDGAVVAVDANGVATAKGPGLAGVVVTIGSTTSPATPFRSCLPATIILHVAGDPAGNFTNSVAMNVADTKVVQADMIDENGVVTAPAPVSLVSNNPVVVSLAGSTITAAAAGGAGLQAVCVPPTCGSGLNTPIYSNIFSVTVNGTSTTKTTVWAASSFPVPTGTIMPLVPIDISTTPPTVGSALGLPGVPNSIVFDPSGAHAYIGTDVGLVVLDPAAKTVNLVTTKSIGKVLAVSRDGNSVIISNAANNPATGTPIEPVVANQRFWVFNASNNTITTFISPGAVAASFDDDAFRAYVVANNGNIYVFSPVLTLATQNIGGANRDAATLASGPFVYVANSAGLEVLSTCNNVQQPTANNPPTNSSNIQLVGRVKNKDQIVAVDSTGVNLEIASVTPFTAPVTITSANCAPPVSYNNVFFDFGVGAFTARQLLVSSDANHIAVVPAGLNRVLTVLPGAGVGSAVLPTGATEAFTGGMTQDGNTIWVGVGGTNSVDRINLLNNADEVQLPMTFKKVDGSAAPPDLVAIRPN